MRPFLSILFAALVLTTTASAQSADTRKKQFNLDKTGLAIDGYDPVSYFNGKPLDGKKDLTLDREGVTYRFATTADRDAFKADPAKYEPQYGGWCAYAMGAKGDKVEVDPETYKIIDGKLYLFYNKFFNNTLKSWNKDESHLKTNADQSWTKFIH
jgi:YHS domain-containing protein